MDFDDATGNGSDSQSCNNFGGSEDADTVSETLVWVGTFMVILASFVSCFGLNLQKLSHNRNETKEAHDRKPMWKSWRWVLGMLCMVLGSLLDVMALPFVPMSRVSALGASGMIANIMITPVFLKEKLTKHDIVGGVVTIIGTTLACYFGASTEPVITSDCLLLNFTQKLFVFFAVVVVIFLGGLYYLMEGFKRKQAAAVQAGLVVQFLECVGAWENMEALRELPEDKYFIFVYRFGPQFYPVVFAVFSGTVGAFSVMFVKAALIFVENAFRGVDVGKSIGLTIAFLIPTALLMMNQIRYLNTSLQIYRDALFVLPVYQALWIAVGIISGLIFYREYEGIEGNHMTIFIFGVLIALGGIIILSRRTSVTPEVSSPLGNGVPCVEVVADDTDDSTSVSESTAVKFRNSFMQNSMGSLATGRHTLLARGSLAESFSLRTGDVLTAHPPHGHPQEGDSPIDEGRPLVAQRSTLVNSPRSSI